MFGFSSPSELPLSSIPVGVVVSTTASIPVEALAQILKDNDIPVEVRSGQVIVTKSIPIEIIGQKTTPVPLKWVLTSRGKQLVLDPQKLKWTIT